jgi:hypothetical protein
VKTQKIDADRPLRVERMTGLARDQVDDLVRMTLAAGTWPPGRRQALDPYRAVVVVLLFWRHNLSRELPAELSGCSQPTVSRLIARLTPVLTKLLTPLAEQVEARELRSTVRVDGFLAPTGDRRQDTYTSGMYSGKRHRCGFNVRVVASWRGRLVCTGTPMPGPMHDARAFRESGLAAKFTGRLHTDGGPGGIGDTAYHGTGLLVPQRRPKHEQLTAHARDYNQVIASRRACVERTIAHLKNWRILATGYRGILDRFPATLDVITKLEIYRTSSTII